MAGLPPDQFAGRLQAIADRLRGLARDAAEGIIDGMESIAEGAVRRLSESTPRSSHADAFLDAAIGSGTDHIADGWTARRVQAPEGFLAVEVVNVNPRANASIQLSGGGETTLLEILEYGSRRHDIVPVNAPFLVFMGGGGDIVRTKHVDHPGTQPYAMVSKTQAEVDIDMKRLIDATRRRLAMSRMGRA